MPDRNRAKLDPMDNKRLGERIREMRLQREWSQTELGRQVGVSKATVSQWELGQIKDIRLRTVLKLVQVLGTTLQYLVNGPPGAHTPPSPGRPERLRLIKGNRSS